MTTKTARAPKALTAREFNLITQFRGIPKEAQERVLAVARGTAEPERWCHPDDRTDARMRAYAASMRDIQGVAAYNDDIEEARRRGLLLIERLAASANYDDAPTLRITPEEVADVLAFIATHEPVNLKTWWSADDSPSPVCGFYSLVEALEASLRQSGQGNAAKALRDEPDFAGDLECMLHMAQHYQENRRDVDLEMVVKGLERMCARFNRILKSAGVEGSQP